MRERKYGKIVKYLVSGVDGSTRAGADYQAAKAGIVGLSNDNGLELGALRHTCQCYFAGSDPYPPSMITERGH